MAWYNKLFPFKVEEKLNPAQPYIKEENVNSRERVQQYEKYYETLEVVNRGVNMIVDDAAEIPISVGEQTPGIRVVQGIKKSRVNTLLNYEPNPFQDVNTFKRNLITDILLDGNIFIYFDGAHLYHLPANKVVIKPSEKTYVENYVFDGKVTYFPTEIIHIKENSFYSIYRGVSRLKPALRTMEILTSMRKFQDSFFSNGAVPGLVIKSPNTLSEKIKLRLIESWINKYRPDTGGKRPMILDGGLEIDSITDINFKELDFQPSITENEKTVLKALGVPPILLDSGNNANIRPNMRMYYLETILPITRKINFAYERFFGYIIKDDVTNIPALQPELQEQAAYYGALVNTGIMSVNESRDKLGLEAKEGHDDLRVPANIAGSAGNPSEGGRPPEKEDD